MLLLSIFSETWPYIVPFVGSLLSAGGGMLVGRYMASYNRQAAETTKQKEAREAAEKALAAEVAILKEAITTLRTAFDERKQTADAARLQDKLKFEADLAGIVRMLERLADVADSLTTMTERVGWHGKELERHEEELRALHVRLESIRQDLTILHRATPTRT